MVWAATKPLDLVTFHQSEQGRRVVGEGLTIGEAGLPSASGSA
jgi:hypothetical protein